MIDKYRQRQLDQLRAGYEQGNLYVILAREKHGDRILNALTLDNLFQSCLKLLKERYEKGYWYGYTEFEKPIDPGFSEKDINNYPALLKDKLKDIWAKYQNDLDYYNECLSEYNAIQRAVADNDGVAAYFILQDRRFNGYEGFELERIE